MLNIHANICIHVFRICLNLVRFESFDCFVHLRNFIFLEQGNIESAIRKGYIEFDREMSLDEEMREDLAGTTAICVIIKEQKLFCVSSNGEGKATGEWWGEKKNNCWVYFRVTSVIVEQ